MNVDDWVLEAVRSAAHGVSLREVQRHIDEHHFEELSVKVLGDALDRLADRGLVKVDTERYFAAAKTNKEDALKKLFGE